MDLNYVTIYNSLDEEIGTPPAEVNENNTILEKMKSDLLKASVVLTQVCELQLAKVETLDIKTIKDIAKIILDLQSVHFGKSEVVINNYQQNISNTQLNYFKSICKDEI